jgi:hypothetical protein
MLHAHGHVQVQQPVLSLDVPVLQQPMLPLDVNVQQQHAFAASGLTRTCSKADFAACLCLYSRLRPLDSSVLQQHMLPLGVFLFFDRLCCLWNRLFHNSLCRLGTCVSSMAACAALKRVSSLCFPWTCPCGYSSL